MRYYAVRAFKARAGAMYRVDYLEASGEWVRAGLFPGEDAMQACEKAMRVLSVTAYKWRAIPREMGRAA